MNVIRRAVTSIISVVASPVRLPRYTGDPESLREKLSAYYDSFASDEYYAKLDDKGAEADYQDMARRDMFESLCAQSSRILDFGCGTGSLAYAIADRFRFADVHGIDLGAAAREMMLSKSDSTALQLTFRSGDLIDSGYDDGFFDLVISRFVVEHIVYPGHMIEEANRIMAPGGYLYMVYPHIVLSARIRPILRECWTLLTGTDEITYLKPDLCRDPCRDSDAVWLANTLKLRRLLKKAGFAIVANVPTLSLLIGRKPAA